MPCLSLPPDTGRRWQALPWAACSPTWQPGRACFGALFGAMLHPAGGFGQHFAGDRAHTEHVVVLEDDPGGHESFGGKRLEGALAGVSPAEIAERHVGHFRLRASGRGLQPSLLASGLEHLTSSISALACDGRLAPARRDFAHDLHAGARPDAGCAGRDHCLQSG